MYIYIYRSRNSTGEENKQYNRRMLYWKLVRQRLGSECGSVNLHCDFFVTISNENFLQFIYSCRYMVMRFSPPRATHASLSRSLLTRQVNFIRSLPPSTTLQRSFFFFHSLTIYFSWHAELPPERELVSNECHAFYVFWFLCSSRRETRADDF